MKIVLLGGPHTVAIEGYRACEVLVGDFESCCLAALIYAPAHGESPQLCFLLFASQH